MGHRHLHMHDPGIGDEPVGWYRPHDATPARWFSYGPSLVTPYSHLYVSIANLYYKYWVV